MNPHVRYSCLRVCGFIVELIDECLPYRLAFTISEIPVVQLNVDPGYESIVEGSNPVGCEKE